MRRRRFLKLSAASGIAAAAGPGAFAASAGPVGPAAATVVVTDIEASTDATGLLAVLDSFARNGLSVTCALRPPGDALDGYSVLLDALLALGPRIEIALDLAELGALSPYFQARAAFEARRRLAGLAGEGQMPAVTTVLCKATDQPTAPVGVRSAGIRNVLVRPEVRSPTRSETWPNGVVRFFGGAPLTPWSATLPRGGDETQRLFYISAETFAGVAEADLRLWASNLASALFEAELAGEMTAMPVSELQLRDDFALTRFVIIRLAGESAAMRGFAGRLAEQGIPALIEEDREVRGYWVAEPVEGEKAEAVALADVGCDAAGRLSVDPPGGLHSGVAVLPVPEPDRVFGLDACAVLTLPEIRLDRPVRPGGPLTLPPGQEDVILSIRPDALGRLAEENALLSALRTLGDDGITKVMPLGDAVNAILSQDPIDRRFRRTRAATLAQAPEPAGLTADAAAAYIDDARLAWAFFEAFTDPNTGLCPATANVHTGGDALTWVTMWDVGSQINALVAARDLGLIAPADLARSARRILGQIAGRRSQDRLLPQGVIRTDRAGAGTRDFDGCDAGRLLAALDNLRRHSDLGDEIAALVSSWDLDRILIDQVIYSVKAGELRSTYGSHCAHYAARAFGRWGLAAKSPYQTLDGRAPADGEMAMLEAVAGIGPLGAEPLLLEAMELGMSAESAYLADVLHVAQVEEYAATGELIAVSEMPIRRDPWFIYLGLQLGREAREWAIDVVDGVEGFRTREFLDQNMALSTKAAFLWAAYRPGGYSDALVDYVRDRARLPIGFASNVVRAGGGVAAPFTDLNTNAVILEAIAFKLGAGRAGTRR